MMKNKRETAVRIAPAGPEHGEAIADLHRKLFDPGWDGASVRTLAAGQGAITLLATTGDPEAAVAFILGRVTAGEAEILSVGVAEAWRRRGLAARLVSELSRRAAEIGAGRLFLEVAVDNGAARRLYGRLGFSEVGRRALYYETRDGRRTDALVMSRNLPF